MTPRGARHRPPPPAPRRRHALLLAAALLAAPAPRALALGTGGAPDSLAAPDSFAAPDPGAPAREVARPAVAAGGRAFALRPDRVAHASFALALGAGAGLAAREPAAGAGAALALGLAKELLDDRFDRGDLAAGAAGAALAWLLVAALTR